MFQYVASCVPSRAARAPRITAAPFPNPPPTGLSVRSVLRALPALSATVLVRPGDHAACVHFSSCLPRRGDADFHLSWFSPSWSRTSPVRSPSDTSVHSRPRTADRRHCPPPVAQRHASPLAPPGRRQTSLPTTGRRAPRPAAGHTVPSLASGDRAPSARPRRPAHLARPGRQSLPYVCTRTSSMALTHSSA